MIEFVTTLGGILGIIVSLQLDLLPSPVRVLYSAVVVLFIMLAFLAYSAVLISKDEKRIREIIGALSATFSALLTVPLSIALLTTSAGIVIQSFPYVGVLAAIVVYFVLIIAFAEVIYRRIRKVIVSSFEKIAPTPETESRQ